MAMIEYAEHQRLVKEASLGYEKRLKELRAENDALTSRVAELESKLAPPAKAEPVTEAEPRSRGKPPATPPKSRG